MSHRYNLRSRKNAPLEVNKTEENIENKPLNENTIQRDDIIYGNFNEGLCSRRLKQDLLAFVAKWKELLLNISDKMIENVKKTDYEKDPYDYLQVNNLLFLKLKDQSVFYVKNIDRLSSQNDYENIKTLFLRSMFNEDITDLVSNNTAKYSQVKLAKELKEKIQKQTLKVLKNHLTNI
jgi:hypothetical protein